MRFHRSTAQPSTRGQRPPSSTPAQQARSILLERTRRWVEDASGSSSDLYGETRAHTPSLRSSVTPAHPLPVPHPPNHTPVDFPEDANTIELPPSPSIIGSAQLEELGGSKSSFVDLCPETVPIPETSNSSLSEFQQQEHQSPPLISGRPDRPSIPSPPPESQNDTPPGASVVSESSSGSESRSRTTRGRRESHRRRASMSSLEIRLGQRMYPKRARQFDDLVVSLDWYNNRVWQLSRKLPKLDLLNHREQRHEGSGRMIIYDYIDVLHTPSPPQSLHFNRYWPDLDNFRRDVRLGSGSRIKQRLIFVEDLSSQAVELLGATFQINPEFFADHLQQSGYHDSSAKYAQLYPDWETLPSVKDHTSFEWYRPILPLMPIKQSFRDKLIDGQRPRLSCPYPACNRTHNVRTLYNIWRWPWKLSPIPTDRQTVEDENSPMGWRERVTVWTKVIAGCAYSKNSTLQRRG